LKAKSLNLAASDDAKALNKVYVHVYQKADSMIDHALLAFVAQPKAQSSLACLPKNAVLCDSIFHAHILLFASVMVQQSAFLQSVVLASHKWVQ
jgi:hypothetical protein